GILKRPPRNPKGEILLGNMPIKSKELNMLQTVFRIGLLCNESKIKIEKGQYSVDGDPTEGSLIIAAMKAGLDPEEEKYTFSQLALIPFESEKGYMATLHQSHDKNYIFVKGSPERVLEMCSDCLIDAEFKKKRISEVAHTFAREGLRVIALGYKEVPKDFITLTANDVESGITYAGLQGMLDPPRSEAAKAIEDCHKAGIQTKMITGDHAVTAHAISKKLGILTGDQSVITGKEIEVMSDDELYNKVKMTSVFARVAPHHKLRITQQLLNHGEIVAVTGDGVNDAPALKIAHIGVAMGKAGTDVAKEASDMIIADDNFATIVAAVEEGRVVYDNIKKVVLFLISCGLGELITIFTAIVMRLPLPFLPAQILWLNLVTNGLQDVALAFEPAERGILKRPPRNPKEGILSSLMIQRTLIMGVVLALGTLFVYYSRLTAGASLDAARTAALTTMVFFQFYQALNCRSETQSLFRMSLKENPFLMFSMIAALFAQLAVIYVPPLQWIFRTVPISVTGWIEILAVTISIVVVVEVDKNIRQRKLLKRT
ncbi:cation-translocating P-type ATPase, partial [candidate division CSSED10-310 bacterium]